MINIAELLKDCPRGMELDCASYDNVSFDKISDDKKANYPIFCYITDKEGNRSGISFTENGCESKRYGAKCVIFPKGKNTWEGFHRPFVEGDIVSTESGIYIGIVKSTEDSRHCYVFCSINDEGDFFIDNNLLFSRFATEQEKAKLFKAIKDNGYRWDEKSKTLEKLTIFKDGDVIYNKDINALAIFYKQTDASTISYCFLNVLGELRIHHYHSKDLSDWKFATEEEKEKLFKVIKDKGYHWNYETKTLEKLVVPEFKVGNNIREKDDKSATFTISDIDDSCYYCGDYVICNICDQDNWELVPNKFDINTLVPFESKVLVRNDENQRWIPAFWGYKVVDGFITTFGWCKYCIPYEGNEHLLNTSNEPNIFFKT